MTFFGSIVPPHTHTFIVSEGIRICSTCGAYPYSGETRIINNTGRLTS